MPNISIVFGTTSLQIKFITVYLDTRQIIILRIADITIVIIS